MRKLSFCGLWSCLMLASSLLAQGQTTIPSHFDNISATQFSVSSSFCKLFEFDILDRKSVRTKALLFIPPRGEVRVDGGTDELFYSNKCNNRDYFAAAELSDSHSNLINQIVKNGVSSDAPRLIEITVLGRLSVANLPVFGHLGWLRAKLIVAKVISATEVTGMYELPDTDLDAPILEAGNSLRFVNSESLNKLLRGDVLHTLDGVILQGVTKISLNGRPVNLSDAELPEIISRNDAIRTTTQKVNRSKNKWTIGGQLVIISGAKTKTICYVNTFTLRSDNSWVLNYSNLKTEKEDSIKR